MRDILTTNFPELVELYIKGTLTIDFRYVFSRISQGRKCYLYASSPVQAVMAEAIIEDVVKVTSENRNDANITKLLSTDMDVKFLDTHLSVGKGYLVKFKDIRAYDKPITIGSLSLSRAPMSWCYV